MTYQWDFSLVFRYAGLLVDGAIGTAILVFLSLVLSVPLGLLLAILRMARIPVITQIAIAYVEFFRAAPSIVLIYWFFFAFPIIFGLNFTPTTAATLSIGLRAAAFLCEVFRSGVEGIPTGQAEAARSLGMMPPVVFFSIILPQALRNMTPVLLNRLIDLIKTTSLASVIAYTDIVYSASMISTTTFRPVETYAVLGGIFFVVIFSISLLSRLLERSFNRARA